MAALPLQARLAADPGAVIETVAAEEGVTARAVIDALPEPMRYFGEGSFFADAMRAIARWGDVTLVVPTAEGILEVTGPVPEGKVARGHFNLSSRIGRHGQMRSELCGGMAFVERPFLGQASAFVAFLNVEGGIMFEVFVGRDADGGLHKEQLAAFRALREAVVAEHIDDD